LVGGLVTKPLQGMNCTDTTGFDIIYKSGHNVKLFCGGNNTEFTSKEGLYYMNLLYQELLVPLSAMVCGLEAIKTASLKRFSSEKQVELVPYFDHLVARLKEFS